MAVSAPVESRIHPPYLPEDRRAIQAFLAQRGLAWDEDIDYSVACWADGALVGTGSLSGRIIKCLAVDESVRGDGLSATLVSQLEAEAAKRGTANPFVFTHPRNREIFSSMGYRVLGEVPGAVILLEKGDALERWLQQLRGLCDGSSRQRSSVLVMNCNPLTKGHLHLIRTAAETSSRVFLFVVAEEASVFPFEVRLGLVQAEAASLPNVTVIPGREYLVSRATFPAYFLKDCPGQVAEIHARLDADLFGRRIAPALGATRRLVGEEPYCPVTAVYNRVMKAVLPGYGIELVEIPRLSLDGVCISASSVRRLLGEGKRDAALRLVPPATAAYLASEESKPVRERIAAGVGRH